MGGPARVDHAQGRRRCWPEAHVIRADDLLEEVCRELGIDLAMLVAGACLWANPGVHRLLAATTEGIAWYPKTRRYRAGDGEKKGQSLGDVYLDDNTYANSAIKQAIGVRNKEIIGF